MDAIRENRKKAQRKLEEAKEVLDKAQKRGGGLTDEEQARYEGLVSEAHTLRQLADRQERIEGHLTDGERRGTRLAPGSDQPMNGEEFRSFGGGEDDPNYSRAFRRWLRHGKEGIDAEERHALQTRLANLSVEQRALSVGTDSAGGYTVPQSFYRQVVEVMKAFDGVREAGATVLRTADGTDMPIPTSNDTTEKGAIQAENTDVSENDVAFGQKVLGSYMYTSGLVKVSFQLAQDSGVDLDAFLANALGRRLGRILNEHFTTGDGSGKPEGILTAATKSKAAAADDAIGYDDLLGLVHTIDPAYRGRNAAFMMNDATLQHVRGLKDANDRPLWQPSLQAGQPSTLLGHRVITNPEMPDIAAEATPILFGDFSRYFIRDVEGGTLLRLTERFATALQIGFIFYGRHDGVLTDANAVAYLEMAAAA